MAFSSRGYVAVWLWYGMVWYGRYVDVLMDGGWGMGWYFVGSVNGSGLGLGTWVYAYVHTGDFEFPRVGSFLDSCMAGNYFYCELSWHVRKEGELVWIESFFVCYSIYIFYYDQFSILHFCISRDLS